MTGLLVIRAMVIGRTRTATSEQVLVGAQNLLLLKRAAAEKIAWFETEFPVFSNFSATLIVTSDPEIPVGLWHPAAREFRSRL